MEDNDEAMTTKIFGVDDSQQEDGTGNLISSNLAMVFSKLPELLAQTKYQLDSISTSSDHHMATAAAASTDHYISCIKINGVPILPPILDENSKKEMQMYREEAVKRSKEREKQKRLLNSTSECSAPAHSLTGNASKNDSHDFYDSLESSQQETVLAQALAPAVSPQCPTKDDQLITTTTTTSIPVDSLSCVDWKRTDVILNSFSDLGSLDDGSLPTQLHGIPLTSKSEQQITRDLSTLSKHLPESCSSAPSELCDLSLDLNSRLTALSPTTNLLTAPKCAFSCSPTPLCLTSTSSPLSEFTSDQNPAHAPENASTNIQSNSAHIFKAPIFLTEDNGLHLSVKKQSPTSVSCSPSLKESPVVNKQPWIMNSPLIAYVTKKRPKPVGMCSLTVKPDTSTKVQRVNNATFTIVRGKQSIQDDDDQENDYKPPLKRPVINTEERSSTPFAEFSDNSSISPGKKISPKVSASPSSKRYQIGSHDELSKSLSLQNFPSSLKVQALGPAEIQRCKSSVSSKINVHNNNNNNCRGSKIPKVNLDDAISLASSSSLSTSPHNLSVKEHLGDDSLDELLLGVENIGLVPRIDGDGSDVPLPSSLLKDSQDLTISRLSDQQEIKQAWQKNTAFHSPELVRSNFSPVGTDSPLRLQASVATVDVTTSSGIASLCDMSTDSPVTCLTKRQSKVSSDIVTDASTNFASSGIRRGSYTLLEPSINLVKLAQLTPSPTTDNHNSSSISEKIPSYADFETQLHKRIPSKNQSTKSVQSDIATPSRLLTPVKQICATKSLYSDPKCSIQKKALKRSKSVNQIKKTKDSFHMTPQLPKTKNSPKCLQNEKSKTQHKLSTISQPNIAKKTSPKTFREWRLSNIDKISANSLKKDVENMLKDETSTNVSMDSPLPSPSLTNDNPLDWDNKIEDQMKCFFSEKKNSYFQLKKDFNDWQEKMEVAEQKFKKTLESITLPRRVSENWKPGLDFLTPDISFTSTEHGQIETPVKQLFEPQTPAVSPVSSQVSGKVLADNVPKPTMSRNNGPEKISAAVKGFLTRRLLSCPKVVSLRKTIQECVKLLEEIDNSHTDFINRINNQLESSRQEIHAIFFDKTLEERMALIRQSRELPKKKSIKNKVPQLSYATQKYQMRKKAEKAPMLDKNIHAGKVASIKQIAVCSSIKSPKPNKDTAKIKQENRLSRKTQHVKSVRKIAPPNVPKKPNKIVSVAGKMTATRIVATKANAGPLRNNNYKPWR